MNYVTTNIRLPEEDYLALKAEASRERKSFAHIVRSKLKPRSKFSDSEVVDLMKEIRKIGEVNSKYLKGVDGVRVIREMRDNAKW